MTNLCQLPQNINQSTRIMVINYLWSKLSSSWPSKIFHHLFSLLVSLVLLSEELLRFLPLLEDAVLSFAQLTHDQLHPVQVHVTTVRQEALWYKSRDANDLLFAI